MTGIWTCKIGFAFQPALPDGSDAPMREAVRRAFIELTGHEPNFIMSGWGGTLTDVESEVLLGRKR